MLGRNHAATKCVLSTNVSFEFYGTCRREKAAAIATAAAAAATTVNRRAAAVAAATAATATAAVVLLLLCCCCCVALLCLLCVPRVQIHRGVASCACTSPGTCRPPKNELKTSAVTTLLKKTAVMDGC